MRRATGLLIALALVLGGCSHHREHHARGEEHYHHAPHVHDTHPHPDVQHRMDSDPDTWHSH